MDLSPSEETSQMTSSYHEIRDAEYGTDALSASGDLADSDVLPSAKKFLNKARNWVGDLSLDGIVSQEGQQVTYVAQDITEKLKTSPVKDTGEAPNFAIEGAAAAERSSAAIQEIENEAKKLASSVDTLTENLTGILHSISSMTLDCIFTSSDAVTQLCDTGDASIKAMYQVMAKCEELNKSMHPIYALHQQVKDTKKLLDKVEAEIG